MFLIIGCISCVIYFSQVILQCCRGETITEVRMQRNLILWESSNYFDAFCGQDAVLKLKQFFCVCYLRFVEFSKWVLQNSILCIYGLCSWMICLIDFLCLIIRRPLRFFVFSHYNISCFVNSTTVSQCTLFHRVRFIRYFTGCKLLNCIFA